jgi:hypothetical protein
VKKVKGGASKLGLTLNMDRTKYLCVGGPTEGLQMEEGIKGQACEEYVYMGGDRQEWKMQKRSFEPDS